jgi:hypothetical protein
MVGNNLMFIFQSVPETVPVSNLPIPPCGTGVGVYPKAAYSIDYK